MEKEYVTPEMEIVEFEMEDVITPSITENENDSPFLP